MLQGISVAVALSCFGFSAGCAGAHMPIAAGLLFAASLVAMCGVMWPRATKEFFEDLGGEFLGIGPR